MEWDVVNQFTIGNALKAGYGNTAVKIGVWVGLGFGFSDDVDSEIYPKQRFFSSIGAINRCHPLLVPDSDASQ